jgi:hypothetical protein
MFYGTTGANRNPSTIIHNSDRDVRNAVPSLYPNIKSPLFEQLYHSLQGFLGNVHKAMFLGDFDAEKGTYFFVGL